MIENICTLIDTTEVNTSVLVITITEGHFFVYHINVYTISSYNNEAGFKTASGVDPQKKSHLKNYNSCRNFLPHTNFRDWMLNYAFIRVILTLSIYIKIMFATETLTSIFTSLGVTFSKKHNQLLSA